MGHLINPISYRMGLTIFWKFNYVSAFNHTFYLKTFFFRNYNIINFLDWFLGLNWYGSLIDDIYIDYLEMSESLQNFEDEFCEKVDQLNFFVFKLLLLRKRRDFKWKCLTMDFTFYYCVFLKVFKLKYSYFKFFKGLKKSLLTKRLSISFIFYYCLRYYIMSLFVEIENLNDLTMSLSYNQPNIYLMSKYFFPSLSHIVLYTINEVKFKIFIYVQEPVYVKEKKGKLIKSSIFGFDYFFMVKITEYLNKMRIFLNVYNYLEFFNNIYQFLLYSVLLGFSLHIKIFFSRLKVFFIKFIKYKILFFTRVVKKKRVLRKSKTIYYLYKRFFFFYFKTSIVKNMQASRDFFFLSSFLFYLLNEVYSNIVGNFVNLLLERYFRVQAKTYFFLIDKWEITSRLLFTYICKNLRRNYKIQKIINVILKDLKKQPHLLGYKFLMSGRFTRQERAFYKWIHYGSNPLSLKSSFLDYYNGVYKSRFGICSVKIWIFKR